MPELSDRHFEEFERSLDGGSSWVETAYGR